MRSVAKELDKTPESLFEVVWKPFQLNPRASETPVDKREMYDRKFGKDRVEQMIPYMEETGRKEGIKFSYGGTTANTLQSHRLVEWAFRKGGAAAQNAFQEAIFKRYFELEKSPNDTNALLESIEEAGLDREEADALLKNREQSPSSSEVMREIREYRSKYDVSGVPHFVIGKFSFSGAQDPSTIEKVLKQSLSSL